MNQTNALNEIPFMTNIKLHVRKHWDAILKGVKKI
jgi:hypothetical protein